MFGDCSDIADEMSADSSDSKELSLADLAEGQQLLDRRNEDTDIEMADDTVTREDDDQTSRISPLTREENEASVKTSNESNSSESFLNYKESPEGEIEANADPDKMEEQCEMSVEATSPDNNGKRPASNSPHKDELADNETAPASSPTSILPKLRLNAFLASDPALKPDAQDLKVLHAETQTKNRLAQLPPPPALTKQEDIEALINAPVVRLAEPVLKVAPTDTVTGGLTAAAEIAPRLKLFMCLPCGIHFSSPSTLEAHQAYYCSHRNKDMDAEGSSISTVIAEKATGMNANAANTSSSSSSASISNTSGEPTAKVIKTGKQYACTQCSYSADKKVSLNRHMRMHQTSPAHSNNALQPSGSTALDESGSSQQTDRYCSNCDIRFNNVKTYRAHKMHYCSSRRTDGHLTPKLEVSTANAIKAPIGTASISPQLRTKTPTPAMVAVAAAAAAAAAASLQSPPPQPFLALPTNPILIIPCSLIRAASWIPGPLTSPSAALPNPDSTCYMLDNGNLKPLATALNMSGLNSNATVTDTNLDSAPVVPANLNTPQIPTAGTPPACQSSLLSKSNETLLPENNAGRNVERSELLPPKRKEGARESAPLDLSLRRSPPSYSSQQRQSVHSTSSYIDADQQCMDVETLMEAGKDNLSMDETGTMTPEQIVCAPSLPNSPSMSPSPKRRAISPRSSSMSPPVNVSTACLVAAAAAGNMLDLKLRSMLPADIALKLSETNIINPLFAKQNLELAMKLSAAAAAAVNNSSPTGVSGSSTTAEMGAAAMGKSALLLPGLGTGPPAGNSVNIVGPNTAVQPQIYVKQGVSKCKECNIVFCKYENYLAHKQHYCSARKQDSCEGEAKAANTSSIGVSAAASGVDTTPVAYQQLICAACGIKYSSLDNLRAHQNYYCPKGGGTASAASSTAAAAAAESGQMPLSNDKCSKCKTAHELGQPCPPPPALQQAQSGAHHMQSANMAVTTAITGPNQNLYKCPVCDVVSLTASESRKHMETHGTVKAFRCSICRYKGNTLRGIRTHIRMHFDKKATDLNEEHYMSCILEDEGMGNPNIASTLTQDQLAQQIAAVQQQQLQLQAHQQQQQQQQIYTCDLCNYSSSYKGNVLRHMKLVHLHMNIDSPSISPEAIGIDTNDASTLNGDKSNFNIKTEPLDQISNAGLQNSAQITDDNNSTILASSLAAPPPLNSLASEQMPHIKSEPIDIGAEPSLPATTPQPALSSPAIGPPPPLNAATDENATAEANQKYCQTCDISFNYLKTYLAHKQYYCKNKLRRPETHDSPSPNNGLLPMSVGSPNSMLLMQKNKENLQQEATI